MRTNVYFDGFNFYYGCFKNHHDPSVAAARSYRWANLGRLAELLMPDDDINRIHYCTSTVFNTPTDPTKSLRQEVYLRALNSLHNLTLHYGSLQPRQKKGLLLDGRGNSTGQIVTVEVREEKGTDVNLATYLLMDAFLGDFEQALIVSNDSDLAEPIRIVRTRLNLDVEVISPYPTVNNTLKKAATRHRVLDKTLLASSQFPIVLHDRKGRPIRKPASW